jgi:sec-independent protein translocase protein TatA
MGIGNPLHLMFIGVVALIFLGPKRLPELARSLGQGMREFRESLSDGASEHEEPAAAPVAPVQLVAAREGEDEQQHSAVS